MFLSLLLALSGPAKAHGIWGHVHVTGWAVENMPDDELRAFLYDDPEVFNALLFGAVFTDTGYARDEPASRAYSEHTHWEPFIEDYIQWMRANDPPPWDTLESKKRVAFLLGCASHGLQDSIFDSLFLYQVEERDGVGQSETDPGTDGFLALDEHIRFVPEQDIPMSTVLELYETLNEDVTEEVILNSVGLTVAAYVNDEIGIDIARGLGQLHEEEMPWGRTHYMDPEIPGSLRSEIYPTMRYQQAIWSRLHDDFTADEATVFAFPEAPRRLLSGDPSTTSSWVTLIFGAGLRYEGDLVELLDDQGSVVPFDQANTRWGAGHTRLIRLKPTEPLTPGGWYTARLRDGAELIDGQTSTETWEVTFQVACDTADDPACPDLGELPIASIDGIPEEEPQGNEPSPTVDESCGCQSTGGGWMAGLMALLLLGRQRQDGSSS